ncbi:MAG: hypothetical protein GY723_00435 [bacterium]|nr:hypothetical protein [bacterium]MCP5067568.1 hypothetical protein [bacterium]
MFAGDSRRRPARFGAGIASRCRVLLGPSVVFASWVGLALGCATGWVQEGGRFSHSERGLSISTPPGGPWEAVRVEGSSLTLRNAEGATLSWLRACREGPASARRESRSLLRGIDGVVLVSEGTVDGAPGDVWRADARVRDAGRELRVHTVTRVVGGCTDDWVLVAPPSAEVAEVFDDWWGSVQAPQVAAEAEAEAARGGDDPE